MYWFYLYVTLFPATLFPVEERLSLKMEELISGLHTKVAELLQDHTQTVGRQLVELEGRIESKIDSITQRVMANITHVLQTVSANPDDIRAQRKKMHDGLAVFGEVLTDTAKELHNEISQLVQDAKTSIISTNEMLKANASKYSFTFFTAFLPLSS